MAGEDEAKELCNDSVEGCMQVRFTEHRFLSDDYEQVLATFTEHEHIVLYSLRSIPKQCNNTASKQVVIGEGHGIALLAAVMRKHEENINVQDGCLSVFNKVLDTNQVLPVLGLLINSGMKEILLAMRKFKFAANLQLNGCQLLTGIGLCDSRDDIPQRYRDAAVSVCASVLKVHGEKLDHIEEAANAIGALFNHDVAKAVDVAVVTKRVLMAMEVDPLRSIMQKSIANCLRVMCKEFSDCKTTYLENNGIQMSLKMVERHPALVGFHCDTWNLFELLLEEPSQREMLINLGGLQDVLTSMRYHYAHKGTQLVCARICDVLSQELPASESIWDWGEVVRLGMNALELHMQQEALCVNLLSAFRNVLYCDDEKYGPVFMEADMSSVERTLNAVKMYDTDDMVQNGYQTLWRLSNLYDEFHGPFFQLQGDQHIPTVMNRYAGDVVQLEPATGVLRNLLTCTEFPTETKYHCLGVLLNQMRSSVDNQGYVEEVCGVLSVLSATQQGETREIGTSELSTADIVSLLLDVLVEIRDPKGPQAATLLALYNIIQASGGVEGAILEVLKEKRCLDVICDALRICHAAQGTQICGMQVLALICQHPEISSMMPPSEVTIPLFKKCADNIRFVEQTQSAFCQVMIAIHSNRALKQHWKDLIAADIHIKHLRAQSMHQNSVPYQTHAMDVLLKFAPIAPLRFVPMVCNVTKKFMQHEGLQTLAWKVIAVWARDPQYQKILHEHEMTQFSADRLDAFMSCTPYTVAVNITALRLAVTEISMKEEVSDRGAMITLIKLIEERYQCGETMFAVFSLLGD